MGMMFRRHRQARQAQHTAAAQVEAVESSAYDGMDKGALKAECDRRGLPVRGSKADLIGRLIADDAESPADEGHDEDQGDPETDGASYVDTDTNDEGDEPADERTETEREADEQAETAREADDQVEG